MTAFHRLAMIALAVGLSLVSGVAMAHDVAEGDKAFVQAVDATAFWPFLYLGAKHMVTGYDHILFLVGVVFFLRRLREIILYASLFTIGHSLTLMGGVLLNIGANAYLIDAIIGFSVVYKGFDNLGGFRRLGIRIDQRAAILIFGLFHGMGLATKLLELGLPKNGLFGNLLAFNAGVETGQILVLIMVVALLDIARRQPGFARGARAANIALIVAGLALTLHQLKGYISS